MKTSPYIRLAASASASGSRDHKVLAEEPSVRSRRSGRVRLHVHHANVKSIKRSVKCHRKRILRAQKMKRRRRTSASEMDFDLLDSGVMRRSPDAAPAAAVLRKTVSTDSDELEVDGCSEEDQEEAARARRVDNEEEEEHGFEVDSGCDEWDLSKDINIVLEWATLMLGD